MNHTHDPRVVLYLGAGASQFAGYRTFADFPVLVFDRSVRRSEGLHDLPPQAERLLTAIKEALEAKSKPTTHDMFLWRIEQYRQLLILNSQDPALQPFLREARGLWDLHVCTEDAVNVMATTTVHHYSSDRVRVAHESDPNVYRNMRLVYELLLAMADLNGAGSHLPIFTTNYDMLVEDLCHEFCNGSKRPVLVNGLPNVSQERATWTPAVYEGRSPASATFHLFRLHGCACWFYHHQGNEGIYFHRVDAAQQSIWDLCAMYPGLEMERGAGPHGYGFRAFHRYLQACDLVVFIGFSFRDDDVMHVLLKALAERKGQLKVLMIDKMYTTCDVQMRLREAARRSPFPVREPNDKEMIGLKLVFGSEEAFADKVISACKTLLGKEK